MQFSDRVFATVTLCHLNPWKKVDTARANTVMKDMVGVQSDACHTEHALLTLRLLPTRTGAPPVLVMASAIVSTALVSS